MPLEEAIEWECVNKTEIVLVGVSTKKKNF
jgi:hypothetical protein